MLHVSLFSGIGGFDLAAQWNGWTNVASCEIAEFPRKVLQYHFPNAYHHDDIHTLTYQTLNNELETRFGKEWRSDDIVLSGGFPCQPYSLAGKRQGKDDARHLWPEMLRVIREIQPRWVVGENVFGLVNWNGGLVFDEVQSDLEAAGYEVQAFILPACAVNAPHRRDRVWFVAYTTSNGTPQNGHSGANERGRETFIFSQDERREIKTIQSAGLCGLQRDAPNAKGKQNQRHGQGRFFTEPAGADEQGLTSDTDGNIGCKRWMHTEGSETTDEHIGSFSTPCKSIPNWNDFPTTQPTICSRNDGLSSRLDGITFSKWRNESIKAYGNAVVPQVVYQIFKTINEFNNFAIK